VVIWVSLLFQAVTSQIGLLGAVVRADVHSTTKQGIQAGRFRGRRQVAADPLHMRSLWKKCCHSGAFGREERPGASNLDAQLGGFAFGSQAIVSRALPFGLTLAKDADELINLRDAAGENLDPLLESEHSIERRPQIAAKRPERCFPACFRRGDRCFPCLAQIPNPCAQGQNLG
jgi:hypothetical protein